MTPLIETLEISLWLKFLIDATMQSSVIFAVGVIRVGSASPFGGSNRTARVYLFCRADGGDAVGRSGGPRGNIV